MRVALLLLVWIAALLLVAVTVLPETAIVAWWTLAWEFVRPHVLVLAILVAGLAAALRAWVPALAMAAVFAVQTAHILPYTPLRAPEIPYVLEEEAGAPVDLVALNVKMNLEDRAPVIEYLSGIEPDVLLLMETDAAWMADLEPILDRYETVVAEPRSNFYGMVLATNLPAEGARAEYFEDETPTIVADLTAPDGGRFTLLGLHPQPPVPGRGMADHRDQLLKAGEMARRSELPIVALGDFNEPGWAAASREFRDVGEYLDPRVGRLTRATFDAGQPFMRFVIDHLYATEGIDLISYGRGPDAGTDHRPVTARLAVTRDVP